MNNVYIQYVKSQLISSYVETSSYKSMMMQFIQITFSFWQYATMMTIVLELVLHVLATCVHAQLVLFSQRLMATNV